MSKSTKQEQETSNSEQIIKFMENLILTDYILESKHGEDWFLKKFKESFGVSFPEFKNKGFSYNSKLMLDLMQLEQYRVLGKMDKLGRKLREMMDEVKNVR